MLRRIGLACLVPLALFTSAAWAAPASEDVGAKALWQAFPLDPTDERLAKAVPPEPKASSEAVRAVPERADAESGPVGAALVLATGVVLVAVLVTGARRLNAPRRRGGSRPLSQTGWSAARQRILDYGEPVSAEGQKAIAAWRHYPDIPGDGRVRALELPPGEAEPPPPPAEWRSVA